LTICFFNAESAEKLKIAEIFLNIFLRFPSFRNFRIEKNVSFDELFVSEP